MPHTKSAFSNLLTSWRAQRRLSQMALAQAADTTPRHVSFLETGRSRPGRGLVLRLAEALTLSLQDQNEMLRAAGFALAYAEPRDLDITTHPLAPFLQKIVDKHDPYPAAVLARHGKVILCNTSFAAFSPNALGAEPEDILTTFLDKNIGEKMIANWSDVAWSWMASARRDYALRPSERGANLIKQGLALMQVEPDHPALPEPQEGVISPTLVIGNQHIETFTTMMRFDTAQDVLLAELRIEFIYPKDAAGEMFFAALTQSASSGGN